MPKVQYLELKRNNAEVCLNPDKGQRNVALIILIFFQMICVKSHVPQSFIQDLFHPSVITISATLIY